MDPEVKDIPTAWSCASYPDEAGFRRRIAATLPAWAARPFGERGRAASVCPDTGLPVRTWALEGEAIISPYTGRRYRQGDTGYFGPKERDTDGRITRFGGDPLKYDLPPVIARLSLGQADPVIDAFLSIPGNLRQQYHFAAVNWTRFYGLHAARMTPAWGAALADAVAAYREERRPSDGAREYASALSTPHDLVGEPGHLLNGNMRDGGTENHKTQWRTSGLLYAQWFGPGGRVSGRPAPEAERVTGECLRDFARRLLQTGNGEYDSTIYYAHTMVGFLNLYDFSPDPATRALAKFVLDYFFATYGFKMFNGTLAGASKRGFGCPRPGETDILFRMFGESAVPPLGADAVATVHQATTTYRPNRVVYNILAGRMPLPCEAFIARPSYHMDRANVFQETFYRTGAFALGSVAMAAVDNPGQQTVWSLVTRGAAGSLVFGGGQPRFRAPMGHSPYDQVLQKRGAMLLLCGQTLPGGADAEQAERAKHGAERLALLPPGMPWAERVKAAPGAAEVWLFVPRGAREVVRTDRLCVYDAGSAWVVVHAIGGAPLPLAEPDGAPELEKWRGTHDVLVIPGDPCGFVLDVVDRCGAGGAEELVRAATEPGRLDLRALAADRRVVYTSLAGDELVLQYRPAGLRCQGWINGAPVDWDHWCGGDVYESPCIRSGGGVLDVRDADEGWRTVWTGDNVATGRI